MEAKRITMKIAVFKGDTGKRKATIFLEADGTAFADFGQKYGTRTLSKEERAEEIGE
jgi:hypothetical protein